MHQNCSNVFAGLYALWLIPCHSTPEYRQSGKTISILLMNKKTCKTASIKVSVNLGRVVGMYGWSFCEPHVILRFLFSFLTTVGFWLQPVFYFHFTPTVVLDQRLFLIRSLTLTVDLKHTFIEEVDMLV